MGEAGLHDEASTRHDGEDEAMDLGAFAVELHFVKDVVRGGRPRRCAEGSNVTTALCFGEVGGEATAEAHEGLSKVSEGGIEGGAVLRHTIGAAGDVTLRVGAAWGENGATDVGEDGHALLVREARGR